MEMKDSGKRQEFEGGAVRDTAEGKPKMSLLSPHIYELAICGRSPWAPEGHALYGLTKLVKDFMTTRDVYYLVEALKYCIEEIGVDRLCNWLELGAKKYEAFNWAKGMYITRCLDSLLRHARRWGSPDEDHPAAVMCNLMFIIHYVNEIEAGRLDPKWDDRFKFKQYAPEGLDKSAVPANIADSVRQMLDGRRPFAPIPHTAYPSNGDEA